MADFCTFQVTKRQPAKPMEHVIDPAPPRPISPQMCPTLSISQSRLATVRLSNSSRPRPNWASQSWHRPLRRKRGSMFFEKRSKIQ